MGGTARWAVAAGYVEPGASASDDKRPEFQRMIERTCDGESAFDLIVAHSFSRLFRDAFGLEFYLRKLAKHGVRLVSITQELGDDPAQVMMRQVIALFDEYQSKENAKHVLRSVKENALERRPSAVRLYGGQGCAARQPDRQEARHRPGRSRNRAPDVQACSHGHSSTSGGRNTSSSQAARVTRQGRRRGERMPSRMTLHDRTAVITGAGSGIGRAIAQALARRGCHLALVDISEPGLAETVQLVDGASIRISRHRLDVADRAAVATLPQAVVAEHGRVDLMFNNAGVALAGTFDQVSEADFDWLIEINFAAVVRLTRAFLPHLKSSDDARIVNMSSLFGLVSPPGQTAYAASKFAVRGFSNALRFELAGSNVGVTVVHPGGVATKIAENARRHPGTTNAEMAEQLERARRVLTMRPEKVGEIVVRAVERRTPRVVVGGQAKMIALIERLAPVSYWKVLEALAR